MKTKSILFFVLILVVTSLTACLNPTLPFGIWQSEDLNLILFIDPDFIISGDGEFFGTFPGVYLQDSEEIEIMIAIEWKSSNITLRIVGERPFFDGYYLVENGRLHIRHHLSEIEPNEIIFNLVEDVLP